MPATSILAFDCTTPVASVALRVDKTCVTRAIEHGKQASLLVPTVDVLLKNQGVHYRDLGCIVTTIGPGSFTGLRIALATLHGLVLAHGTPVKTLTSLEAVAWQLARLPHAPAQAGIQLNAGKGEVFYQAFRLNTPHPQALSEIALLAPQEVPQEFPLFSHYAPHATLLCEIAPMLAVTDIGNAMPLYIRPPDAKLPKKLPWLQEAL